MRKLISMALAGLVLSMSLAILPTVRASDEIYKVVFISDGHYSQNYGNPDGRMTANVTWALQNESDLVAVIDCGDMTYDQGTGPYTTVIKHYYDLIGVPYYVEVGNHDIINYPALATVFGVDDNTWNYYRSVGPFLFIMLNLTGTGTSTEAQRNVVNAAAAAYPDKLIFIVTHSPRHDSAWPAMEANDTALDAVAGSYSGRLVSYVAGHVHHYNDQINLVKTHAVGNLHYSYAGTYGSNYSAQNPGKNFTYLRITMTETFQEYQIRAVRYNFMTGVEDLRTEVTWSLEKDDTLNQLIDFIFIMLTVGVVVTVISTSVMTQMKNGELRHIRTDVMMRNILNTVITLIISLALLTLVFSMFG